MKPTTTNATDIDLGGGVTLRWIHKDEPTNIVGASICHPRAEVLPDGQCCGYIGLRGRDPTYKGDVWGFDGDYTKPTLEPSVLCSCGFHGFVRAGRWVSA